MQLDPDRADPDRERRWFREGAPPLRWESLKAIQARRIRRGIHNSTPEGRTICPPRGSAIQRTFSVTALSLCPLLFPTGAKWAERLFTSLPSSFLWACGRLGDRERFFSCCQWRGLRSRPMLRVRTPRP